MLSPKKSFTWLILSAIAIDGTCALAEPQTPPPTEQHTGATNTADTDAPVAFRLLQKKPVAIKQDQPPYPRNLQAAGVSGPVTLLFTIGSDGNVRDISVTNPCDPKLAALAVEAVREWKYKPAKYQGKAVATRMQHTLPFAR